MFGSVNKRLYLVILSLSIPYLVFPQGYGTGVNQIRAEDLEIHVSYLASDYLQGRGDGEPGLETALKYIASQARRLRLKAPDSSGYFEQYCLKRSYNPVNNPHYEIIGCSIPANPGSDGEDRLVMHNVVAWIEGSDPELKSQYVIFSCHADHLGVIDGSVYAGADDDASGCAALIEIAEAFQKSEKRPLRSVVFLWLTGEEIGLFGSQAYVDNPLFPLNNTVADLNLDMIGRVRSAADSSSSTPVTGPLGVYIISDEQSKDLMAIAAHEDSVSPIEFDYSLSGRNTELNLFARSDHFNFVKHNIPVLFFTTGLHSDYHTTGDVPGKLDYSKMERVAKSAFDIGWAIADRRERLVIDNPYTGQ